MAEVAKKKKKQNKKQKEAARRPTQSADEWALAMEPIESPQWVYAPLHLTTERTNEQTNGWSSLTITMA